MRRSGHDPVLSSDEDRLDPQWRRRVRRPGLSRSELRHLRQVAFRRKLRIVVTLLALTGCAVEPPRPDVDRIPPGAAIPEAPPPIISKFGDWGGHGGVPRLWQHTGVDIRVRVGTPVLAAADGAVVRVGRQALAGKFVIVSHGPGLATVYYHLSEVGVTPGQTVQRGDPIARSGMTGNATAPHLHFGVCLRETGACGESIQDGWANPVRYWIPGNPCFVAHTEYPAEPVRLTYPVPCGA
jgi:murein DD-endopeptidase MepM/ murein hydrolase activator NlpD